jgi:hypothetical protein
MPGGDRTGPMGAGPMTGRGLGLCGEYGAPGYTEAGAMPRFARRGGPWGGGRGWRHWYHATGLPGWMRFAYAPPSAEQEKEALKGHAKWLEDELAVIRRRIDEAEKE